MRIVGSHAVPGAAAGARGRMIEPAPVFEPPIVLFAQGVVASSGELPLPSKALSNLTGHPIEISAVSIAVSARALGTEPNPLVAIPITSIGGMLQVSLALGDVPLTNGYVPCWGLSPIRNVTLEDALQLGVGATPNVAQSRYDWRFSTPMRVPPGAMIVAQFRHLGLIPQSITAQLSLLGKIVRGDRRTSRVPYVSAYVSPFFEYLNAGSDQIPETALINATGKDVRVDRLVGRIGNLQPVAGTFDPAFTDGAVADGDDLLTVHLHTSQGAVLIRDPTTPFRLAFSGASRTLECGFDLAPGAWIGGMLMKMAPAANSIVPGIVGFCRQQATVSLVGWREVSL